MSRITNPRALLLCVAALLAAPSLCHAGITVYFDPDDVTVGVGDTFDIDILADIQEPVTGWGIDLEIVDDTIANLIQPPDIGPLWFAAFAPDGDDLAALAFPNAISGNGILLATLTFEALEIGETDLLLSHTGGDNTEGFALTTVGQFGDVTYMPGHIEVVPGPGGLALIAVGFIMPGRRRRR